MRVSRYGPLYRHKVTGNKVSMKYSTPIEDDSNILQQIPNLRRLSRQDTNYRQA